MVCTLLNIYFAFPVFFFAFMMRVPYPLNRSRYFWKLHLLNALDNSSIFASRCVISIPVRSFPLLHITIMPAWSCSATATHHARLTTQTHIALKQVHVLQRILLQYALHVLGLTLLFLAYAQLL